MVLSVHIDEDSCIRSAREDDVDELTTDPSAAGLLRDRLRRADTGEGELWVYPYQGTPVGHVFLWLVDAEEDEIRDDFRNRDDFAGVPLVMNLWVRADHRRSGIGTALMRHAEARLSARGYHWVALGVDAQNSPAIDLYTKMHYELWHDNVKTVRLDFEADGTPMESFEVCTIYIKDLQKARVSVCS